MTPSCEEDDDALTEVIVPASPTPGGAQKHERQNRDGVDASALSEWVHRVSISKSKDAAADLTERALIDVLGAAVSCALPPDCDAGTVSESNRRDHQIVQIIRRGNSSSAKVDIRRRSDRPAFSKAEREAAEIVIDQLAATLTRLDLESNAVASRRAERRVFLQEAIDGRQRPALYGNPVRVAPGWVYRLHAVLLAVAMAAVAYLAIGRINRHARGPAVIGRAGRTLIPSLSSGPIVAVLVHPGQQVAAGQALVRLQDQAETGELTRLEAEWAAQVRNVLRDPRDTASGTAVRELNSRVSAARARLAERQLLAPRAGVVSDVWASAGHVLQAGDTVAALAADDGLPELIAALPGSMRPLLAEGMRARFEVDGFPSHYLDLRIAALSTEVVSASEARRILGAAVADGLDLPGRVTLVRLGLPSTSFICDGIEHPYHEGMRGTVDVATSSDRIVTRLLPGLARLLRPRSAP